MAPKGPAMGAFTLREPTTMHLNSASSSGDRSECVLAPKQGGTHQPGTVEYWLQLGSEACGPALDGGSNSECLRRSTPQIAQRPVDEVVHAGKYRAIILRRYFNDVRSTA